MKVYKVVRENSTGQLISCTVDLDEGGLVYEKDVRTVPRFGKILAFSNECTAKDFGGQVWEAESTEVEEIHRLAGLENNTGERSRKLLQLFWSPSIPRLFPIEKEMLAPPGTVACSDLTLLKRIA